MSTWAWLQGLHLDALQEVLNVAMGQAGASLARLLDRFVCMSAPSVQVMEIGDVSRRVTQLVGEGVLVTAVRQSFIGELRGESLLLLSNPGFQELAEMMGEGLENTQAEQELALELGNLVLGACLLGIAAQLEVQMGFTAPTLVAERVPIDATLFPRTRLCTHALLIEIVLKVEHSSFRCHLLVLTPQEGAIALRESLERFVEKVLSRAG